MKYILPICMALALFGCGDDGDIIGADTDNNGVRDDVDKYIAEQAKSPDQKVGLSLLAISFQITVNAGSQVSKGDEHNINKLTVDLLKCAGSKFESADDTYYWHKKIRKKVVNTKSRKSALKEFNRRLGGGTFLLPKGDQCHLVEEYTVRLES